MHAGGVHDRVCVWQEGVHGGHAWQWACVTLGCTWKWVWQVDIHGKGGMHGRRGVRGRKNGSCSRQYALYWNASLFVLFTFNLIFTACFICKGYVFIAVCLSIEWGGGVWATACWDAPPGPEADTSPRADTSPSGHPNGHTSPWADTQPGRHPPGRHPLGTLPQQTPQADTSRVDIPPPGQTTPCTVHAGIRSTNGRYVSHWNAFLSDKRWISHNAKSICPKKSGQCNVQ